MWNKRIVIRGALLIATMSVVACGGSTLDPAAPSAPTPTGRTSGSGTASISGTLAAATTASRVDATAAGLTVTIEGTNISTTVPPGGTFVLNGVPTGNVTIVFTGPGVDGRVTITDVQDQEEIRIIVNVRGSQATVQITDRHKPQNGTELEGLITSLDAGARMFVVNGKTVSVPVSATIRNGNRTLAFSDLKVGQRVHVKGTMNGSTLVAAEVKLQEGDDDDHDVGEAEGTVSALTGGCPSLSFMVKTTKVTTSPSMQFKDGPCSRVANGVKVEVKGTRQADGSIAATSVEIDD